MRSEDGRCGSSRCWRGFERVRLGVSEEDDELLELGRWRCGLELDDESLELGRWRCGGVLDELDDELELELDDRLRLRELLLSSSSSLDEDRSAPLERSARVR